MFTELNFSFD